MSETDPSQPGHHHRRSAPRQLDVAVVTVSDTRTLADDTGGEALVAGLAAAGQRVVERRIVRDEIDAIRAVLDELLAIDSLAAIVFTGGTGVSPRDVTPEALEPRLERVIPGFGELFRMLSYQQIGSAALLSRALAGFAQGRVVFALPGSRGAIALALEKLLLPELGHLVGEARKGG